MAIQYVDTNRQNTTFVPTSKQDLINNIETVLLAAGWTTVSGHNTTTLVMQSATTPQGLKGRIRVKDNSGTCVQISIEDSTSTVASTNSTTAGFSLNPGSSNKTYRMIANKYQAFIYTAATTPAREFACFGVPWIPPFLVGVITQCIWGCCNSWTDSDTAVRPSFRTQLSMNVPNVGGTGNYAAICNSNIIQSNNGSGSVGGTRGCLAILPNTQSVEVVTLYRWHDGSANLSDVYLGWNLSTVGSEGQLRGQMWDAMLSGESYTGDITAAADSHNWIALTDSNAGIDDRQARGTVFIATP